jgi:hypothetical protein
LVNSSEPFKQASPPVKPSTQEHSYRVSKFDDTVIPTCLNKSPQDESQYEPKAVTKEAQSPLTQKQLSELEPLTSTFSQETLQQIYHKQWSVKDEAYRQL